MEVTEAEIKILMKCITMAAREGMYMLDGDTSANEQHDTLVGLITRAGYDVEEVLEHENM